jgi:hypothetical protein|nr:MAG TPA: hypothetical protein [Caudoviricetes sp.]
MKEANYRLMSLEGNQDSAKILEVAEKAKKILQDENHIMIDLSQAIPTIVEVYLRAALESLANETAANKETITMNFFDLFQLGFDVAEDDSDEKGGNIVPAFVPLGAMKTMGKSDETQSGE